MSVTWDNPLGHNLIATRRCNECDREDVRMLWARPLEFAGGDGGTFGEEVPLTMPDIANMLRDAPFRCPACDGGRARLVAIEVDESCIPF
ncbi:hypothetical protein ASF36_14085 [Methylobacterium sp. Leaf90]|nr:hypothetical protein ASF36_14085 [Methylobacterium sp. Leaf90]